MTGQAALRKQRTDFLLEELDGGGRLGIHPASESLRVQPGSLQLAFAVDDVDRFVTDARTVGVRILQEPHDENFGRIAVVADPDGYAVQVATMKDEAF